MKVSYLFLSLALLTMTANAQESFPEAKVTSPKAQELCFEEPETTVLYIKDLPYATKDGTELHLQMLLPHSAEATLPCIVYVQGSAWMKQNVYMNIPQLADFAARGFVVAIVEYRHTGIAPFPAQCQDAKTAIRYLRMNADKYKIDPTNLFIWGDSSGGHTSLLVGLTQDTDDLDDNYYGEVSCKVNAAIAYYPPTDISVMKDFPSTMDHNEAGSPEGLLIGGLRISENVDKALEASPISYISKEKPLIPIMLAAGTMDKIVPFSQTDIFANKMEEMGKEYEYLALREADHGTWQFWTEGMFDRVETFIRKHLAK